MHPVLWGFEFSGSKTVTPCTLTLVECCSSGCLSAGEGGCLAVKFNISHSLLQSNRLSPQTEEKVTYFCVKSHLQESLSGLVVTKGLQRRAQTKKNEIQIYFSVRDKLLNQVKFICLLAHAWLSDNRKANQKVNNNSHSVDEFIPTGGSRGRQGTEERGVWVSCCAESHYAMESNL